MMNNLNKIFIILGLFLLMINCASATQLEVDGENYTTISSAITAASTGDTINIHAGTYNEALTVNKGIIIQGDTGNANDVIISATNPITLTSNDVIIKNLKLTGIGSYPNAGVKSTGYGNITINNIITDCATQYTCTDIRESGDVEITNSHFNNNFYYGVSIEPISGEIIFNNNIFEYSGSTGNADGICIDGDFESVEVCNNIINGNGYVQPITIKGTDGVSNSGLVENNTCSGWDECNCLVFYDTDNGIIRNNDFQTGGMITDDGCTNLEVYENNITTNSWYSGYNVVGSTYVSIHDNDVVDSAGVGGISVYHDGVNHIDIYNNYFHNCIGTGDYCKAVDIKDANSVQVFGNTFENNKYSIYVWGTSTQIDINNNNFTESEICSVYVNQCTYVTIDNNNFINDSDNAITLWITGLGEDAFCEITNNYFYGTSDECISLKDASNCIIESNIFNTTGYPFAIYYETSNNVFYNNTVINLDTTGCCFYIRETTDRSPNDNVFYGNAFYASSSNVSDFMCISPESLITDQFWNSQEQVNYTIGNITRNGYIGNYWLDYTGVDENNDGIGDTPFLLNFTGYTYPECYDYYPLISPLNSNNNEDDDEDNDENDGGSSGGGGGGTVTPSVNDDVIDETNETLITDNNLNQENSDLTLLPINYNSIEDYGIYRILMILLSIIIGSYLSTISEEKIDKGQIIIVGTFITFTLCVVCLKIGINIFIINYLISSNSIIYALFTTGIYGYIITSLIIMCDLSKNKKIKRR